MFSASLFPQILQYDVNLPSMQCVCRQGRNSVEQNAIVPDNSDRALLRQQALLLQSSILLTNEYPRICHVMH